MLSLDAGLVSCFVGGTLLSAYYFDSSRKTWISFFLHWWCCPISPPQACILLKCLLSFGDLLMWGCVCPHPRDLLPILPWYLIMFHLFSSTNYSTLFTHFFTREYKMARFLLKSRLHAKMVGQQDKVRQEALGSSWVRVETCFIVGHLWIIEYPTRYQVWYFLLIIIYVRVLRIFWPEHQTKHVGSVPTNHCGILKQHSTVSKTMMSEKTTPPKLQRKQTGIHLMTPTPWDSWHQET